MKRLFLLLILAAATLGTRAAAIGEWTAYLAFHDAEKVVPAGDVVYAIYAGNLLAYTPETDEVKLFSKNDGLNGHAITHAAYSKTAGRLLLVYDDLNIDILDDDGTVYNLAQVKESADAALTVNDVRITGTAAAVATSNGVIHIDLAAREIRGYYRLDRSVASAAICAGHIYAATAWGVFGAALTDNLSDASRWTNAIGESASFLLPFGDALYLTVPAGGKAGFYRYVPSTETEVTGTLTKLSDRLYTAASATTARATFRLGDAFTTYVSTAPEVVETTFEMPTGINAVAESADGTLWAAAGESGLKAYRRSGTAIADTGLAIGGYGPRRDLCYYLTFFGQRLFIGGGRLDYTDLTHNPGTVMTYDGTAWDAFEEDGIAAATGVDYNDVTRIAQDPADTTHYFVSSARTGLYEFRSGRFVGHYSLGNSPLKSAASGASAAYYVRIDGLNYDADGNLWMVNNGVDSTICILRTDGTWERLAPTALRRSPTMEKTLFDSAGRFWVAPRRSASSANYEAGIFCLDYNGTITNTADDVTTYRRTAYNQDGTSCSFTGGVYDLMEDADGSIWVGTADGLFVISDPSTFADSDFRITQIKVPRNDGTNYADYLLAGVAVNAIARDGAGRKWIGTLGNGLYLVSADGTEIIKHFEAASSPLLSDNVYDVAISPTTGEVFIGTDEGLCSYGGDATEPAEALTRSNVKVYPNPVRPGYTGNIIVSGLTAGADVQVTTTGGQLVAAGTSQGGTFTWDGRTSAGRRVATGVYYIMAVTSDGKTGIVAKVVVI